MKIAIKFFQTLVIAVAISVTLLSIPGMAAPAAAQECNGPAVLPRSHGMVSRINVKDFNKSMDYYQNTLKLKCNPTFFTPPYWAEFYQPDSPEASIGINPSQPFESKNVPTLIVPDLAEACGAIKTSITESEYADKGVCLAFFTDLSGNTLAYRQEKWSGEEPEKQCKKIISNQCAPLNQ